MQVRRLMEDDNSKQRKAARREFQENVRALVAFVRKRDARVIARMEQEEIKKAEREAAEERRSVFLRFTLHLVLAGSPIPQKPCFLSFFGGTGTQNHHIALMSSFWFV